MAQGFEKYVEIISRQEELLRFEKLTQDDCLQLGLKIIETTLRDYGTGVSVRIDLDGVTCFYHLMGEASLSNDWWMQKKLNGCMKTGKSSFLNYLEIEALGHVDEHPWAKNQGNYALRGGCIPLKNKDGELLGFAVVSGLPQVDDHQMLANAIAEYLGIQIPSALDGGMEFIP